jgi:hypothetical protein
MVTSLDNMTKENLENLKELQAKAASGSVTGMQLMHRDLRLIQRHKVSLLFPHLSVATRQGLCVLRDA